VIQHLELHRDFYDVLTINVRRAGLDLVKQIRMIAYFLQLHQHIQESDSVSYPIHCINVPSEYVLVQLLLKLGKSDKHVNLTFCREVLLHINLESPQHEGPQQSVNLLDDRLLGGGL